MSSQVQTSWVARCRQLKKEGMTVRGISEKLHLSRGTVGRYVRGMADQREIRDMQNRTVCPINPNNKVGQMGHADQNSMSHMSQGRGKGKNIGVDVLLFLLLAILILVLLDHFVLEGKILDWFFGQLKLKGQSQGTEEEDTSMFFEGRSLDDT